MVLQACLGLEIEAMSRASTCITRLCLKNSSTFAFATSSVGNGSVDISCERYAETVSVNILRRSGQSRSWRCASIQLFLCAGSLHQHLYRRNHHIAQHGLRFLRGFQYLRVVLGSGSIGPAMFLKIV